MADSQKQQVKAESDSGEFQFSDREVKLLEQFAKIMKTPYVDEVLVERKKRDRDRLRKQREESERNIAAIQSNCPHRREDNTSAVAWAVNFHIAKGLYIKEGVCQRCNKWFTPGSDQYADMIMIPTRNTAVMM